MTVREALQAKYNKGEVNFKELNNLYKKFEDVLDLDKDVYNTLYNYFKDSGTMNDIIEGVKKQFFIPVSKPVNPGYTDYTIELDDTDFHPVYDPKYKTVTIRRR